MGERSSIERPYYGRREVKKKGRVFKFITGASSWWKRMAWRCLMTQPISCISQVLVSVRFTDISCIIVHLDDHIGVPLGQASSSLPIYRRSQWSGRLYLRSSSVCSMVITVFPKTFSIIETSDIVPILHGYRTICLTLSVN